MNLETIATRLKEHLSDSTAPKVDEGLVELAEAHLCLISAAAPARAADCHASSHNSGGHSSSHTSGTGGVCGVE